MGRQFVNPNQLAEAIDSILRRIFCRRLFYGMIVAIWNRTLVIVSAARQRVAISENSSETFVSSFSIGVKNNCPDLSIKLIFGDKSCQFTNLFCQNDKTSSAVIKSFFLIIRYNHLIFIQTKHIYLSWHPICRNNKWMVSAAPSRSLLPFFITPLKV